MARSARSGFHRLIDHAIRIPAQADDKGRAMIDALWLKALLKTLVLPPTGPLLVALFGLLPAAAVPARRTCVRCGRRRGHAGAFDTDRRRFSRRLRRHVPSVRPRSGAHAKAVVILGGGVRRNAPEYGGDTLATLTLERVRYGARVARLTGLPVLVSGGRC